MKKELVYRSDFWEEEPEEDNPFAAKSVYCHGYNVYEDVIRKARWSEYIYLLFRGERPSADHACMLEVLSIALANQGPRDLSIRSAMNGGVGGSVAAGTLMAALGVGAGQYGGAREVYLSVTLWEQCGTDTQAWALQLERLRGDATVDIWPTVEHAPGFDPNSVRCALPISQLLKELAKYAPDGASEWLCQNREILEKVSTCPLGVTGVAGAAFYDLGFKAEEAEMLYLILKLPGAAVHALEQQNMGWKQFPFIGDSIELLNDPGSKGFPAVDEFKL